MLQTFHIINIYDMNIIIELCILMGIHSAPSCFTEEGPASQRSIYGPRVLQRLSFNA